MSNYVIPVIIIVALALSCIALYVKYYYAQQSNKQLNKLIKQKDQEIFNLRNQIRNYEILQGKDKNRKTNLNM